MNYIVEARPEEVPLQDSNDQKVAASPTSNIETQNQALLQRQHSSQNQPPLLHSQSSLPLQSSNTLSPSQSKPSSWARFAIPTKEDSLSSGFPFHPRLYDLKVTNDQWHVFTHSLVTAAKLTPKEDYLAWTTGIATGTLTSPFLVFFAPWAGYHWGRKVHRKKQAQTVQEKLAGTGDLRAILHQWNTETFAPLGFQAWLEVPRVAGDLVEDTSEVALEGAKSEKQREKMVKMAARRFKIIIIPSDPVSPASTPSTGARIPRKPVEAEGSSQFADSNQLGGGGQQQNQSFVAELHEDIALPPSYIASKGDDFLAPSGTTSRSQGADGAVAAAAPANDYNRPAGFSNS